jgi:hypothetical protein
MRGFALFVVQMALNGAPSTQQIDKKSTIATTIRMWMNWPTALENPINPSSHSTSKIKAIVRNMVVSFGCP